MNNHNVVVIGSGPGGYVAAIRCAQLGAKVLVVEKDTIGGTCLNRGCIPTKTLLATVGLIHEIKTAGKFGIRNVKYEIDFSEMMGKKNKVVAQLKNGIGTLFKSYGIDVLKGKAEFTANKQLEVISDDGQKTNVNFEKAIIATGSAVIQIPGIEFDNKRVITSTEILELEKIPESLLIVGGGFIGVEFAAIFSQLGAKVTIIEKLPSILPGEDEEISKLLSKCLTADGIRIKTNEELKGIPEEYEKILVAVGRKPYSEGLGVEKIGVNLERGKIIVNSKMETNISGIYAVGDVVGGAMLAYKASDEGIIAAENAVGNKNIEINYNVIPNCIFTNPEVATVGLTEPEAIQNGYKVKIGRFPFAANSKAVVLGQTKGFVKMVVDSSTGGILGVAIIGPKAAELISQASILLKLEATTEDMGRMMYPHPTLSEALYCAAEAAEGKVIDLPKT